MRNERHLISRNKREGGYGGRVWSWGETDLYRSHMRTKMTPKACGSIYRTLKAQKKD